MALQIKVTTVRVPNLDKDGNIAQMEEDIEDAIKVKFNNGFSLIGMASGDNFAILVFKKET